MDVRVLNMPCASLEDMSEVICKISGPAAAETIPFPSFLMYCNVIDLLSMRGTLKYFEPEHPRLSESFMPGEVTAVIEAMKNVVRSVKYKKTTAAVSSVSPPGQIYLPRPLQQFLYLETEAASARDLCFHIVAPKFRISANSWRPCETSYQAILAEVSTKLRHLTLECEWPQVIRRNWSSPSL